MFFRICLALFIVAASAQAQNDIAVRDAEIARLQEQVVELKTKLELVDKGSFSRDLIDVEQLIQSKKLLEKQQRSMAEELARQKDKVLALTNTIAQKDQRYEELSQELSSERQRVIELKKAILDLREQQLEQPKKVEVVSRPEPQQPAGKVDQDLSNLRNKFNQLRSKLKEYASVESDNAYLRAELEKLRNETKSFTKSESKRKRASKDYALLKKQFEEAQQNVDKNVKEIIGLRRENAGLKNELLIAREEVRAMRNVGLQPVKSSTTTLRKVEPPKPLPVPVKVEPPKEELKPKPVPVRLNEEVVEIVGPKVNLRAGPSTGDSMVYQVEKGSRLLVEAVEGDWYRVVAPNGGRAYVLKSLARLVPSDGSAEDKKPQTQIVPPPVVKKNNPEINEIEDQLFNSLRQQLGG